MVLARGGAAGSRRGRRSRHAGRWEPPRAQRIAHAGDRSTQILVGASARAILGKERGAGGAKSAASSAPLPTDRGQGGLPGHYRARCVEKVGKSKINFLTRLNMTINNFSMQISIILGNTNLAITISVNMINLQCTY